ncbi:MAG TPA: pseudouridine synthase [Thermoanaerobaculia bacterium]|nr:pseudouridine synthase [Thermoanaerobaculia bacterium]
MERRSNEGPDRRARPAADRGSRAGGGRGAGRVPLERALSKLGLASRSVARRLIGEGRVMVDGRPATDALAPVIPERIAIAIDGVPVQPGGAPSATITLHKPRGAVTTRADPQGRPTVYSCLGELGIHLVPVGRLDAATTGLLLLTNDTRFADWVTDPANGVPRVYLATVRGHVAPAVARQLEAGIVERGERLAARAVVVRKSSRRESHLVIELAEGKNREVRRLLAAAGHEVTRLKRVSFGGLALGDLAPGSWRLVPPEELQTAFPGAPLR